jgi:hypothetical protein
MSKNYLRTLRELGNKCWVGKKQLRAEAVKWLNSTLHNVGDERNNEFDLNDTDKFLKLFFNITEEDLNG